MTKFTSQGASAFASALSTDAQKAPSGVGVDAPSSVEKLVVWLRHAASHTLTPMHTIGIAGAKLSQIAERIEALEHALAEKDAEIGRLREACVTAYQSINRFPGSVHDKAATAIERAVGHAALHPARDGGAGS